MLSSSINLQWPPFIQRAAGDILTDYGPFVFGNRPVGTRTPGVVGAGGEKPPATRCTPGTGVNLWGESPLYVNPVNVKKNIDTSTSRRQGRNREGPSKGSRRATLRADEQKQHQRLSPR